MDGKILRLPSTVGDGGSNELFSAGFSMSPFAWDTVVSDGSKGQQQAFKFDDHGTSRMLLQQDLNKSSKSEPRSKKQARNKPITRSKHLTKLAKQKSEADDKELDNPEEEQAYRSVDEEQRLFKEEIKRRLLTDFNLEKTISKYRSMSAKQYKINPAEFSFDCALSAERLRDRLRKFTSSEVISINDRKFTDHICYLLEEQTKLEMEQADRRRAQQECLRLRRLMQLGIITADTLKTELAIINGHSTARKSSSHEEKGIIRSQKRLTQFPRDDVTFPSVNDNEITADQLRSSSVTPSSLHIASSRGSRSGAPHRQHRITDGRKDTSPNHQILLPNAESVQSSVVPDSEVKRSRSSISLKFEPPLMKKLREEQRLHEMFRIADQLLYRRTVSSKL